MRQSANAPLASVWFFDMSGPDKGPLTARRRLCHPLHSDDGSAARRRGAEPSTLNLYQARAILSNEKVRL